jgi:hypothetical protein
VTQSGWRRSVAAVGRGNGVRVNVPDPDGNAIAFAEPRVVSAARRDGVDVVGHDGLRDEL